jgi:hypothetical protein
MLNLISGGFAAGYRTYLMGGLLALQAIIGWAVGDMTFVHLLQQAPEILAGLGLMSLRASIT